MKFENGRKILTLLTFGCPNHNQDLGKVKAPMRGNFFFHPTRVPSEFKYSNFWANFQGGVDICGAHI